MITGAIHPRHAIEWLAEIDESISVQNVDNSGVEFGDYQMSFATLDFKIAKGLVKIMNPKFKRKIQLAEEIPEKKNLPMWTGRQIALMIYRFKINDVQRRVPGMNDLLDIELLNDSLKTLDEAWENILMAPEKEPEDDLLKGLYHRQLEKSTSMQNAFALYHSDQSHRKEPKSCTKSRAMVTDSLKDQQQFFPQALKQKGRVKEAAMPVATVNSDGERQRGDCRQGGRAAGAKSDQNTATLQML